MAFFFLFCLTGSNTVAGALNAFGFDVQYFDVPLAYSVADNNLSWALYIPALKLAFLQINIYSSTGAIPKANAAIVQVPDACMPYTTVTATASVVLSSLASSSTPSAVERGYMNTDGIFRLNNFATGTNKAYFLSALVVYRTAN